MSPSLRASVSPREPKTNKPPNTPPHFHTSNFSKFADMLAIRSYMLCILCMMVISLTAQSDHVRVMSFNIRYDNPADGENNWHARKADIVHFLRTEQPDILGIQEGLWHQVQFLDSALLEYKFVGVGRDDGARAGEFCALYYDTTKCAVLAQGTFWHSPTPDTPSIGWDAALPRICTYALMQDIRTAKKYWVFNTHFDHVGAMARMYASLNMMYNIYNVWNTSGLPVIVMGDLNAETNSESYAHFTSVMQDTRSYAAHPVHGPDGTFNGFSADNTVMKRIDYIFTSGCIVHDQFHLDTKRPNGMWLSDHLPVMADISFK